MEDPKSFKRIPTCHRTSYDAVTADADYLAAVQYADATQRSIYEAEAKAIDGIQKNILAIVKDEKPFDVFLCYKETDENGKRTVDSTIANDIYYQLTQEGMKVFYAAITLEDKLGQEYEPYIFAALNSAKVMLVIGTKPQYFTAVWVKNEWSRFLKLMKTDRSKLLIPCYRDMDAYELPEEFAHLQAQDMGKIGFINDVVRGIKKVAVAEPKTEAPVAAGNAVAPLLKRAFMFLEDGDWSSANEYCEKVLDSDPENAQAYLGKLMAELQVRNQEALEDCPKPFDGSNNFQKALRFADDGLKATLTGYITYINTRNENARLEAIYAEAQGLMGRACTEDAYKKAARLFQSIPDYQDSAVLAAECIEKAEIARKDTMYNLGKMKMVDGNLVEFETAIKCFAAIPDWKDANQQIAICKQEIEKIKAELEADRLECERKAEEKRRMAEKAARRKTIIMLAGAAAVIAIGIIYTTIIMPSNNYKEALSLMEAGKYEQAISAFETLGDYKDSVAKIHQCEKLMIKSAKVGMHVYLGTYDLDGDASNGKESVQWEVLDIQGDKMLLLSEYAIERRSFNTELEEAPWQECTLRQWLNSDFIGDVFSETEKNLIITSEVSTAGVDTQDKLFLLSGDEVEAYMPSVWYRRCSDISGTSCAWWLRSPGVTSTYAKNVSEDGTVSRNSVKNDYVAVRPAMWIDLSKIP